MNQAASKESNVNAIMENSLRQTVGTLVSPALDPEVAAKLATPGQVPKIRVPHVATLKDRIGSIAKRLLDLERQVDELRGEDRSRWEDASADLDAILHEAEHAAGLLDEKLNGEARELEAAREEKDWAKTEKILRTFGMSAR